VGVPENPAEKVTDAALFASEILVLYYQSTFSSERWGFHQRCQFSFSPSLETP
jgi:hypothetical protein